MRQHSSPTGGQTEVLSARISTVLDLDPSQRAVEFAGTWHTWQQLGHAARAVEAVIGPPGGTAAPMVGILLRNRPAHVAAFLGVLLRGGCVVVINPARGEERTRADIDELRLPFVIGEPGDLTRLVRHTEDTTTVAITDLVTPPVTVTAATAPVGGPEFSRPGVAVRMLTSGTTGPPKRIDLAYSVLARGMLGAKHYESAAPARPGVRSGVAIVNSPLVHIGGVFRVLQCITDARPFVLLERFDLDLWVDAVRRHRPAAASLVPTALRMVLQADVPTADLASLRAVVSGTAPLSADDADAFTEKYGIPVLTSYAATEFGGGVAGWTLKDHQRYWQAKRGSVGRAQPDCALRVVDPRGQPLRADQVGLLQVKPGQFGPDSEWVATTDLARIDVDGFLWILGRADQAIIRGGFKVLPDDVRAAIEAHPAVRGAVVVGRREDRLGEVPVAAVELRPGMRTGSAELVAYLASKIARYEIPVEIRVVPELPRTESGKVDLVAARTLLAAVPADDATRGEA